jgi:hypothetical protein
MVVLSSQEFRENEQEHIGWARTARTDKERELFLRMARLWREAADRLDASHATADGSVSPVDSGGAAAPTPG